jgi:hypothetical protein
MQANADYQVHMLRIWRDTQAQDSQINVRLSLENTKTAVRVGFADWDAFVAYLREQIHGPAQLT